MPHSHDPALGKDIPVGVQTDNDCCICCDKCWDDNCNAMYPGAGHDSSAQNCCNHTGNCPTSCCACPPTGNLCATLSAPNCPNVDGMEFSLRQDMGVCLCSGTVPVTNSNVPCYYDSVFNGVNHTIKTGIQEQNNVFEKWAWTGVICRGLTPPLNVDGSTCVGDPGPGANNGKTRGEGLEIILCCCDTCGEDINNTAANPSDCHTCNYQLFVRWVNWEPDVFCTCPDGPDPTCPPPCGEQTQLVPICNIGGTAPPANCDSETHNMAFEDGQCPTGNPLRTNDDTPFILHYTFEDRYWQCDCCDRGYVGPPANGVLKKDVDLTITIVEGDGASGLCEDSENKQPDPPHLPC